MTLLLAASLLAAAAPLIEPGPFGPMRVELVDGRQITVPAETHAFYRMLTQDGRIHGPKGAAPTLDGRSSTRASSKGSGSTSC